MRGRQSIQASVGAALRRANGIPAQVTANSSTVVFQRRDLHWNAGLGHGGVARGAAEAWGSNLFPRQGAIGSVVMARKMCAGAANQPPPENQPPPKLFEIAHEQDFVPVAPPAIPTPSHWRPTISTPPHVFVHFCLPHSLGVCVFGVSAWTAP